MVAILRFFWNATRGHRLQPWKSPFLKWRLETYSGRKAETIQRRDFTDFVWSERRQLLHFLAWVRRMDRYRVGGPVRTR